ncbi:unnamed protein product [Arctia plantaginis]|uniref:Reverse transcriptase Ty1/copia-type domain-containing protein n=1 Tax=Arctia plantaginis TaxID=874455 RepID=A0A8S0Z7Q2_ARCPL|nr:unnamed protein product [Arctia plantaginis]
MEDNTIEDIENEKPSDGNDEQQNEEINESEEKEEDKNIKTVTKDRPNRTRKLPEKYRDCKVYANFCNVDIPENYEEAIQHPDSKKWKTAMDEEIKSLEENNTWNIVKEPIDKKIIEVKWIYIIKSNGKYKARVVAKGFQQIYSENEEIYSPVARMTTLKVLLSAAEMVGKLNKWMLKLHF